MATQLTDTQQVGIQVAGADKKGFPAAIETITFTSSDETVITVTQDSTDPSKATAKAGNPGNAQVQISADSKIGEGENVLTGAVDFVVVAGEANQLVASVGTPEEQP